MFIKKGDMIMKLKNINLEIVVISVLIVSAIAVSLIIAPMKSLEVIDSIYALVSKLFGTPLLWFSLAATVLCFYFAFSRMGKVRLGDEKPDFSLFSYIGMMICAGLASASVYFSFIEWIFFYSGPALGIEAGSAESVEYAPAYSCSCSSTNGSILL